MMIAKRILTLILAVTLIVAMLSSTVFASETVFPELSHPVWGHGEYCYSDDFSVVIGFWDNGMIDIAYKDIYAGQVYYDVVPSETLQIGHLSTMQNPNNDNNLAFAEIEKLVKNGAISLSHSTPISAQKSSISEARSASSDISSIYDKLEEIWGTPYYRDTIYALADRNHLGKLYHTMSYGARKDLTRTAAVGLSMAAVCALLGLYESAVRQIASFVTSAVLGFVLKEPIYAYYADVYYTKNVDVDGENYYSCFRTLYYDAFVGDIGVSLKQTNTTTSGYYNWANRDLIIYGIDIYIDQNT